MVFSFLDFPYLFATIQTNIVGIMKISTKSQYGLRALIYLAKTKKKISPLKEIAEKQSIPFNYLEKIMSQLEKNNIVKAKKGAKGGYYLPSSPEKIKLKNILETLEENFISVQCLKKQHCPLEKKCLAKNFWKDFQKSIDKTLNKKTLKDLIK